jgi:carboxyl-terminal processing protease
MSIRKSAIYLLLVGVLMITFGAGYIAYPLLHGTTLPSSSHFLQNLGGQDMNVYWEAWKLLDRDFYGEKPDSESRMYGAVRGMVESFHDPYTYFVEPEARELERDEMRGSFGGIGAGIEQSDEGYLLRPNPNQPAELAGIQNGDLLLMIGDKEIGADTPLDEVIRLVRGPVGTTVTLLIRRTAEDASSEELTFQVQRAEIETPSVRWRIAESAAPGPSVGYIEHSVFTERSPEEMRRAIEELSEQGADSFVLDMRGNTGGLVSSALAIADMWLDEGVILIEEDADGEEKVFSAEPETLRSDAPLVVLVDGNSASASEIVAGALRDNGRAILVGQKTYGKGSVQLVHELSDESSLHVTNAQWLTPDRVQITGMGLDPDIPVNEGDDSLKVAVAQAQGQALARADTLESDATNAGAPALQSTPHSE